MQLPAVWNGMMEKFLINVVCNWLELYDTKSPKPGTRFTRFSPLWHFTLSVFQFLVHVLPSGTDRPVWTSYAWSTIKDPYSVLFRDSNLFVFHPVRPYIGQTDSKKIFVPKAITTQTTKHTFIIDCMRTGQSDPFLLTFQIGSTHCSPKTWILWTSIEKKTAIIQSF